MNTTCVFLALLVLASTVPAQDDWLKQAATKKVATFDGSNAGSPPDVKKDRREKVVIRRLKPSCKSDWNTDPTALPYFFYQLRERTKGKFPLYLDNEGLDLGSKDIFDYPVIYFTSHFPFQFSDDEVENLKKFLARGGTLLLDDCTGSGPFMDSVPSNVPRILPGGAMKPMLKADRAYEGLFHLVY